MAYEKALQKAEELDAKIAAGYRRMGIPRPSMEEVRKRFEAWRLKKLQDEGA